MHSVETNLIVTHKIQKSAELPGCIPHQQSWRHLLLKLFSRRKSRFLGGHWAKPFDIWYLQVQRCFCLKIYSGQTIDKRCNFTILTRGTDPPAPHFPYLPPSGIWPFDSFKCSLSGLAYMWSRLLRITHENVTVNAYINTMTKSKMSLAVKFFMHSGLSFHLVLVLSCPIPTLPVVELSRPCLTAKQTGVEIRCGNEFSSGAPDEKTSSQEKALLGDNVGSPHSQGPTDGCPSTKPWPRKGEQTSA